MIRSLVQYSKFFAKGLLDPEVRRLIRAHARTLKSDPSTDHTSARQAVADHFSRAQDHGNDAGLGSYHLIRGWSASYPETTGYIIPTLLALAKRLGQPELETRAQRAADWLLSIQRPDGGWQGGRIDDDRPTIVFNTAQVVRGMMAMYEHTNDQKYLDGAARACDRMVQVQEPEGYWSRHNFLQQARVYDSYVSAPLLRLHALTGTASYRSAAVKNLEWVLTRQLPNGWLNDADNTIKHNDRPITHTIAYTLDGLLECHGFVPDQRYLNAARNPAEVLLKKFLSNGGLNGRHDRNWQGSEHALCTGNAQLAIVWARLHALTREGGYAEGVQRMAAWLKAVQLLSDQGPIPGKGAVTGTFPLWGRYEKFAFPNWAQKYLADALLCAEGQLPRY